MTRRARAVSLVALAAALLGCATPIVQLGNHTGEDLSLKLRERSVPWADGERVSIGDAPGALRFNELDTVAAPLTQVQVPAVAVARQGRLLTFQLGGHDVPESYVAHPPKQDVVRYQLEPDGRLYLVDPAATGALSVPPAQPHDFPLAPIENTASP